MRRSTAGAVWAGLGVGSILGWAVMVGRRAELLKHVEDAAFGALIFVAGVFLVSLLGFMAWGFALLEAGRGSALPQAGSRDHLGDLRHPGVIGLLGFLLPGFGLLITGHRRRAAWAMGMVGPLSAAVVIVGHGSWLWRMNHSQGQRGLPGLTLELVLLATALIALVALLSWIVQALEGARCAARLTEKVARGDSFAIALLVSIAVFLVAFKPVRVAETLHSLAVATRLEGLRVIPLCMEEAALRLDPGTPLYAIEAAELHEELGRHEAARRMRGNLHARWRIYVASVRRGLPSASGLPVMVEEPGFGRHPGGDGDATHEVHSEAVLQPAPWFSQ
jgi:hypothetical protein